MLCLSQFLIFLYEIFHFMDDALFYCTYGYDTLCNIFTLERYSFCIILCWYILISLCVDVGMFGYCNLLLCDVALCDILFLHLHEWIILYLFMCMGMIPYVTSLH